MRCTRCAGLSVPEIIYEGGSRIPALRCIHCGDVSDHVIVSNRQRRSYPKPRRVRTPTYGSDRRKKTKHTVAAWSVFVIKQFAGRGDCGHRQGQQDA